MALNFPQYYLKYRVHKTLSVDNILSSIRRAIARYVIIFTAFISAVCILLCVMIYDILAINTTIKNNQNYWVSDFAHRPVF
jgi:hypothetical protein